MFENTFKNIDDILHKDAGCSSELDYVEQSSWILFLKYIDDLESARKVGAELSNKKYTPIISGKFRWAKWTAPKTKDGKFVGGDKSSKSETAAKFYEEAGLSVKAVYYV
jgi:type I restriction enzyme M protein